MQLGDDIFLSICSFILDLKELIGLELLSVRHKKLIRKTKWDTFMIRIKSEKMLLKMLEFHTFLKLDLSKTNVTNSSVSKLINCHTIDLTCTKVTD